MDSFQSKYLSFLLYILPSYFIKWVGLLSLKFNRRDETISQIIYNSSFVLSFGRYKRLFVFCVFSFVVDYILNLTVRTLLISIHQTFSYYYAFTVLIKSKTLLGLTNFKEHVSCEELVKDRAEYLQSVRCVHSVTLEVNDLPFTASYLLPYFQWQ